MGLPVTNDDFGVSIDYGLHQFHYIAANILIVAIRVNDDIRAKFQAGIQTLSK